MHDNRFLAGKFESEIFKLEEILDKVVNNLLLAIQLSKLFILSVSLTVSGMNIRCQNDSNNERWNEDTELPIFDLITISNATDNFAINNKLGAGGFGSVYKVNNNLSS